MGLGRRLLVVLGMWAFGVAMVLLALAPAWPRSAGSWIALVVLGPPAAFAVAWVGENLIGKILNPKIGRRISEAPLSIGRILYALAVFLVLIALVGLAALALEPWLRRIAG